MITRFLADLRDVATLARTVLVLSRRVGELERAAKSERAALAHAHLEADTAHERADRYGALYTDARERADAAEHDLAIAQHNGRVARRRRVTERELTEAEQRNLRREASMARARYRDRGAFAGSSEASQLACWDEAVRPLLEREARLAVEVRTLRARPVLTEEQRARAFRAAADYMTDPAQGWIGTGLLRDVRLAVGAALDALRHAGGPAPQDLGPDVRGEDFGGSP